MGLSGARELGSATSGFLSRRALRTVVTAALEHDIETDFVETLVRKYDFTPGPEAVTVAAWPWPVKIRAFGPLEIEAGGQAVRFGRKVPTVPLALLKLLVAAGEPLPVARVTHLLWPAYGDAARGALDTAVYRLRKLVGQEAAIVSQGGQLSLAEDLCWTDIRAFKVWCDRISALVKGDDGAATSDSVFRCEEALLGIYRGPFGADDDPPPVTRAREQLRRRFARAVAELERLWQELGQGERRAALARAVAERDACVLPFRGT